MFYYAVEVLRVVDGDTVDVRIDLGFNVWHKCRVRLMGINAPESRTRDKEEKARGLAAKAWLTELLGSAQSGVEMQSHGVGKYGRVLGTLYINDVDINKMMIEEGHAVEYLA
jgi:endonuclease YncB( thermonuclease family)